MPRDKFNWCCYGSGSGNRSEGSGVTYGATVGPSLITYHNNAHRTVIQAVSQGTQEVHTHSITMNLTDM